MMAESVSSNPVGANFVLLFSRPLRTLTCTNLPPSSTSFQNDQFEKLLNPMQMQIFSQNVQKKNVILHQYQSPVSTYITADPKPRLHSSKRAPGQWDKMTSVYLKQKESLQSFRHHKILTKPFTAMFFVIKHATTLLNPMMK